jgi:hypothetical protein
MTISLSWLPPRLTGILSDLLANHGRELDNRNRSLAFERAAASTGLDAATGLTSSRLLLLHNLNLVLLLQMSQSSARSLVCHECVKLTFHFSISSCLVLYCFASSTSTLFMLSEFDCSWGRTSPTVRSTRTPLTMRKHLRVLGRGVRVSRTSLRGCVSSLCLWVSFLDMSGGRGFGDSMGVCECVWISRGEVMVLGG